MKRTTVLLALFFSFFLLQPAFAQGYSDTNRFAYGFQRMLLAPFRIPIGLLQGTAYGPPVVGTLSGVFGGTVQTVTDLVGGAFDMAAAASPYAKYAVFAL